MSLAYRALASGARDPWALSGSMRGNNICTFQLDASGGAMFRLDAPFFTTTKLRQAVDRLRLGTVMLAAGEIFGSESAYRQD